MLIKKVLEFTDSTEGQLSLHPIFNFAELYYFCLMSEGAPLKISDQTSDQNLAKFKKRKQNKIHVSNQIQRRIERDITRFNRWTLVPVFANSLLILRELIELLCRNKIIIFPAWNSFHCHYPYGSHRYNHYILRILLGFQETFKLTKVVIFLEVMNECSKIDRIADVNNLKTHPPIFSTNVNTSKTYPTHPIKRLHLYGRPFRFYFTLGHFRIVFWPGPNIFGQKLRRIFGTLRCNRHKNNSRFISISDATETFNRQFY